MGLPRCMGPDGDRGICDRELTSSSSVPARPADGCGERARETLHTCNPRKPREPCLGAIEQPQGTTIGPTSPGAISAARASCARTR